MKKDPVANSKRISVTFEAPAVVQAETMSVVGDFNSWEPSEGLMKQRKDGVWSKAVRLLPGVYRYRFLADGHVWHDDPAADGYEPSGFGEDNSLVIVTG